MVRRVAAITLLLMGAYVGYIAIAVGQAMVRGLFEGGWLGPEPELLIAVALGAVAAILLRMGIRLWRAPQQTD
jgi:hypothetical protein